MKSKQLFEAFSDIDDIIIKEAELAVQSKPYLLRRWMIGLGTCASLLVLFILGNYQTLLYKYQGVNEETGGIGQILIPEIPSELLMDLEKVDVEFSVGVMGFEGYQAFKIDDLVNQNPWNESTTIKRLPLFRNQYEYETTGTVMNTNRDDMVATLKDVAKVFKIEVDESLIIEIYGYGDRLIELTYEQDGLRIEVTANLSWDVWFEPASTVPPVDNKSSTSKSFCNELPEELNFSYTSSYEEMTKVAEYLKQEYGFVLQMAPVVTNINGGDFNINAAQRYGLSFYEGSDNLVERILNYNFHQIQFVCDDNNQLSLIRYTHSDLSEKIGDYPIISVSEATELLTNGQYLTTVWEPFTGSEYIRDVELIYRSGHDKIFMPYYRFYVELPSMKSENGLNTYGAYYVPAIEGRYITNMPMWDGRFN